MTITVIARDAAGKKSTWHWSEPAAPTTEDDLINMARNEVWDQINTDQKEPPLVVLALIANPNKQ